MNQEDPIWRCPECGAKMKKLGDVKLEGDNHYSFDSWMCKRCGVIVVGGEKE